MDSGDPGRRGIQLVFFLENHIPELGKLAKSLPNSGIFFEEKKHAGATVHKARDPGRQKKRKRGQP